MPSKIHGHQMRAWILDAAEMSVDAYDFVVIGGGIAGLSIAAALARHHLVALFEQENQLAYHATGRSAAILRESYGNSVIRSLTRASRPFYSQPPSEFCDGPLLTDRGALIIGELDQQVQLLALREATLREGLEIAVQSAAEAKRQMPILRQDHGITLFDASAQDLDVGAIVGGFRRMLKKRGGTISNRAPVTGLERVGGVCGVSVGPESVAAPVVVNAAGAWADNIARLAGVGPMGLQPLRRTAALVALPAEMDSRTWPCVIDIGNQFYFKPDAGRLLVSPADESPSTACDALPEELDVAEAIFRLECATTLKVEKVVSRWAGLRTFATDRIPVIGFDPTFSGI